MQVIELFGAGTAATVSPIGKILYNGRHAGAPYSGADETLDVPLADGDSGTLAKRVMKTLFDIQYGEVPNHPWAPIVCQPKASAS